MGFDWSKFQDGARFKFTNVGDKVEGTVTRITSVTFNPSEGAVPILDIRKPDGTAVSVTASQVVLKRKLAEEAPDEGDEIVIVYTGNDTENAKPGKSPAKLFDVDVIRAGKKAETLAATATSTEDHESPF